MTIVSQRDSGDRLPNAQQRMFNDTSMGKLDVVMPHTPDIVPSGFVCAAHFYIQLHGVCASVVSSVILRITDIQLNELVYRWQ